MADPADSPPVARSLGSATQVAFDLMDSGGPQLPSEWGEYEQVERIGEGGMGEVYKGWHRRLRRVEAIKTLHPHFRADARKLSRFRFEAEAAATLDHPHIVPVYGVGDAGGVPYFAMKWVDGTALDELMPRLHADPPAAARLLAKVARAIHHAHQRGIIHRDLKPGNVLVDRAGEPMVADFGLAKPLLEPVDPGDRTAPGTVVGTPHYMAPEQGRGDHRATTATDIYAIGVILYEVLTGRLPFTGPTLSDLLRRLATDPAPAPRALNAAVPRDLEAICLKCLEKDPGHRYPTAVALADDLDAFARGDGVSARPPGVWGWVRQALRRTPERFPNYAWEVKAWFGAIILVVQVAVFAEVWAEVGVAWVWGAVLAGWVAAGMVLQWYMGTRFTRLPETERHSMLIAVGHLVAHAAVTVAYLPTSGPAVGALAIYPGLCGVTGLALFVVGSTHWGRFFWFGLGLLALAPVCAAWPDAGPLLYGAATAACMWHWAYAVKVTFGGVDPEADTSRSLSAGPWRLTNARGERPA